MYTHFGGPKLEWVPGIIHSITGPLSYRVELGDGRVVRRHVDHVRSRHVQVPQPIDAVEPHLREPRIEPLLNASPQTVPAEIPLRSPPQSVSTPDVDIPEAVKSPVSSVPVSDTPAGAVNLDTTPVLRRSTRTRHAPDRLGY